MCEGKVILFVRSIVITRDDVIDVKLTSVKLEIDEFIANKATVSLTIPKAALKFCPTVIIK